MHKFVRAIALAATIACVSSLHPISLAQPANPSDQELSQAHTQLKAKESSLAELSSVIVQADKAIADAEMTMGSLREQVNKALVDLSEAEQAAQQARDAVGQARGDLENTQTKIVHAQQTLDEISRSVYRQGSTKIVGDISGKNTSKDALDRQTLIRTQIAEQRKAVDDLDLLRTRQANHESELRARKIVAEKKEQEAVRAKEAAEQAIEENSALLATKQQEYQQLLEERAAAQSQLDIAKATAEQLESQRAEYDAYQQAEAERVAAQEAARLALEKQQRAEAEAKAKAEAEARAAEAARQAAAAVAQAKAEQERQAAQAKQKEAEQLARRAAEAAQAAQAQAAADKAAQEAAAAQQREAAKQAAQASTELVQALAAAAEASTPTAANVPAAAAPSDQDTSQQTPSVADAAKIAEDIYVTLEDATNNAASTSTPDAEPNTAPDAAPSESTPDTEPLVDGDRNARIEAVISRALSQVGTPYAWGGGSLNGPTKGIKDGGTADRHGDYSKVGFDCSGLVLYAFGAAGLKLPHYTGYQYQHGTKVSPTEMQRGDLIFYGPNAENHVAIYIGDGQMVEAPQSGSTVRVAPVRWGGMSPYVVRLL
ncbi:DIP1281 family NlpC/P60 protein [Corynebacterium sp. HS2168-gen11]|uniref:DIP1281 family NlpC/P60 protein n=1 Tax=Corynebacterium sp. HS2168-gen11 TaxID=2974027 RepID=UPI00216AE8FC|nr:NlpC/P60 family protein [Corynebacterium sp. HS2168-gen11]MCS4535109.1 NlpC/P60 family protein [Corynebacterium sp. HS2168-gen11]